MQRGMDLHIVRFMQGQVMDMLDEHESPYQHGRDAALSGMTKGDNPYWKAGDRHDWDKGFDHAIAMLIAQGYV